MLEASGVEVDYATIVDRVYVPGLEGSLQVEMLAAARSLGRIAYILPPEPAAVLGEVGAGRPVLVLLNLALPAAPVWHYAVVVGYDSSRNRVLLHSGRTARSRQRARSWLRRWDWAGRWAMVLLEPGEWPGSAERSRIFEALSAFEELAEPAAAGQAWRAAAEHWPEEPLAWLGVGNAAHHQADWQAARTAYGRVLEIDPDHLPARLNLALTHAEAGSPCDGRQLLGPLPPPEHPLHSSFAALLDRLGRACRAAAATGASRPL